jgi:hypothetical protein
VGLARYLQSLKDELQGGKQIFLSFLAAPNELCSLFQTDGTGGEASQHNTLTDGPHSNCSSEELQDAPSLIVDNVSNQMIDVYLEPLQLKGRDAIARQHQYSAAVSLVEWPYDNSASMEQHVNSILFSIPGRTSAEPYVSWGLRLNKKAVSEEEELAVRNACQRMIESSLSLDLPKLAPFVVTFSENHSAAPTANITSSGQSNL